MPSASVTAVGYAPTEMSPGMSVSSALASRSSPPPAIQTSTPWTSGISASSAAMPWRCAETMILSTPRASQLRDLAVDDRREVALDLHVARRGDRRDVGRRQADDPDPLAVALDDRGGRDAARVGEVLQRGALEAEVGGDERDVVVHALDELGQADLPEVELVVADRHRVVAERVGDDGVGPRRALLEAEQQREAGQEVVAGGDEQRARALRLVAVLAAHGRDGRLGAQALDDGLEARGAAVAGLRIARGELRLAVVVVQQREPEVRLLAQVGLAVRRRRGGGRRGGGQAGRGDACGERREAAR